MAAGDTDIGTGSTITFGTSSYSAEVLNIAWGGISRGAIDISHMATTGGRVFKPTDLYDPGELTVDFHFKTNAAVPITATAESITITFPDAETWSASGFISGFEFTDPMEDKMVASMTVKMTGDITQ